MALVGLLLVLVALLRYRISLGRLKALSERLMYGVLGVVLAAIVGFRTYVVRGLRHPSTYEAFKII